MTGACATHLRDSDAHDVGPLVLGIRRVRASAIEGGATIHA
jgi:hypothetical protein